MSECVIQMEMPQGCDDCPFRDILLCCRAKGKYAGSSPVRPNWCPIICQLPEGHGRLVDADALVNQWATVPDKLAAGAGENKWVADMVMGIQGHFLEGIIKSLEEAPTIVPAERSEA